MDDCDLVKSEENKKWRIGLRKITGDGRQTGGSYYLAMQRSTIYNKIPTKI